MKILNSTIRLLTLALFLTTFFACSGNKESNDNEKEKETAVSGENSEKEETEKADYQELIKGFWKTEDGKTVVEYKDGKVYSTDSEKEMTFTIEDNVITYTTEEGTYKTRIVELSKDKFVEEAEDKSDTKNWLRATEEDKTLAEEEKIGKDAFKDKRDGEIYKKTKIGNQTWMAENLRHNVAGSLLNPENPSAKYGRLYSREMALKACPEGWHLPSDQEWQTLAKTLGVVTTNFDGWIGNKTHGNMLKSRAGWAEGGNGTDNFGFNALPAGYYYIDGGDKDYANFSYAAYFWSATKHHTHNVTYYYRLSFKYPGIFRNGKEETTYYSCRCIKN